MRGFVVTMDAILSLRRCGRIIYDNAQDELISSWCCCMVKLPSVLYNYNYIVISLPFINYTSYAILCTLQNAVVAALSYSLPSLLQSQQYCIVHHAHVFLSSLPSLRECVVLRSSYIAPFSLSSSLSTTRFASKNRSTHCLMHGSSYLSNFPLLTAPLGMHFLKQVSVRLWIAAPN